MSAVVLTRGDDGKLTGVSDQDQARWGKFKATAAALQAGHSLTVTWKLPRSPRHHGLFFAWLGALFERQEQFDDADKLRAWLTVGAGYCDLVPGPAGRMVALPQSIAWDRMDESEFSELHAKVSAFMWTTHAQAFLWGHLAEQQRHAMVQQLHDEFAA